MKGIKAGLCFPGLSVSGVSKAANKSYMESPHMGVSNAFTPGVSASAFAYLAGVGLARPLAHSVVGGQSFMERGR